MKIADLSLIIFLIELSHNLTCDSKANFKNSYSVSLRDIEFDFDVKNIDSIFQFDITSNENSNFKKLFD